MLTSPQLHLITQRVARGLALKKKNVYLFCLSIVSLLAQLLLPSRPCPYLCLCLILIDSVRSSADSSGSPRPLACEHACDLCSGPLPGSSHHTYTHRRAQPHRGMCTQGQNKQKGKSAYSICTEWLIKLVKDSTKSVNCNISICSTASTSHAPINLGEKICV